MSPFCPVGAPASSWDNMAKRGEPPEKTEWQHDCQHESEGVPIKLKPPGQVETRPEHICAKKHHIGHEELCSLTRPGGTKRDILGAITMTQ